MTRASGAGPAAAERRGSGPGRRIAVRVEGVVQGVGFRPFVYRLATGLGLAGSVRNDGGGVRIEAEGPEAALTTLVDRLRAQAPPLARVERVGVEEASPGGSPGFVIEESDTGFGSTARIGPDVAPCDACLRELLDPQDRRYRYAFINCTDCGPRYTIVQGLPYDRARTTMAAFDMCARCRAEFADPSDRRFHAQPNACPACGPRLRLVGRGGAGGEPAPPSLADAAEPGVRPRADAVAIAAGALLAGSIVAVKGAGGYHLACRADDTRVVERLRARKRRETKPFALMVHDAEAALRLVAARADELEVLTSPERPVLLARRRPDAHVASAVAPRQRDLGVMLPSTPLHHLLTRDAAVPLVMTSGNLSGEPTLHRDDEALDRLAGVADLFLVHDRPICARADDSVVRIVDVAGRRRRLTLRRARGAVPVTVDLPVDGADVLAVGADVKSAPCATRGRRACVGPHLGDLERWETRHAFREGMPRLCAVARARPEVVAHDLHPGYASTAYALEERPDLRPIGVQHHHAHLAACLAEHGRTGPALGAILDGTGYGPDGTVWGGELLLGDLTRFRRLGHLLQVSMPGGDAAVRQPWRMACAWLAAAGRPPGYAPAPLAAAIAPSRWAAVRTLAEDPRLSPRTSSAGRLFDAVSALCGLCFESHYEGQAAIELEAAAARHRSALEPYEVGVRTLPVEGERRLILDPRDAIVAMARDVDRTVAADRVAAAFHEGFALALVRALRRLARAHGVDVVALSGGVFQNVLLVERVSALLSHAGLDVLVPEDYPVNDGGVALGQAAVALASLTAEAAPRP